MQLNTIRHVTPSLTDHLVADIMVKYSEDEMAEKTIPIVDDDVYIGDMVEELLTKNGYGVMRAFSGTEASMLIKDRSPDLILLDLMLPGINGEDLLPVLRHLPVIVVSAKAAIADKVNLLTSGAVDYITKPFDTQELLARISVHLRERSDKNSALSYADLTVDQNDYSATVCGKPAKLTKTEYAILYTLIKAGGKVVSKDNMMASIEDLTPDCEESSLRTHIGNLRNKLRAISGKDHIEAVWGIGYKLKS